MSSDNEIPDIKKKIVTTNINYFFHLDRLSVAANFTHGEGGTLLKEPIADGQPTSG